LVPADLVYATSTPLTIGLLAIYLKRRYHIPYIFEVRDLWPEAPIQLGYIQSKLLIAGLRKQEKLLYQRAAAVVALSPGIAEGVKKIYPEVRLHLAPNMADCLFFSPAPKPQALLNQWQLEGKFVISYTGAAGVANHLDYLIAAARTCKEAALPVHFLVAAQGSQLAAMQQQALGLPNMLFLPYGSKAAVREYLSVSDAVYTSFGQHTVLQSCSPNKFFDGLAAGKLCLVNIKGWLKELVESEQCGFYAPPEAPEQFVAKLMPYLQDPQLLQQAQANARRTAEAHFSRQQVSAGVVALIEEVGRES
ncbi:MAG: glycosyltransferase family 4 protein, partial [Bacteroidetes bacterium]|nr:glycosyltransferase family 4 protein [Bacteroidota bacterium]